MEEEIWKRLGKSSKYEMSNNLRFRYSKSKEIMETETKDCDIILVKPKLKKKKYLIKDVGTLHHKLFLRYKGFEIYERWVDLLDYNYQISNFGKIRDKETRKLKNYEMNKNDMIIDGITIKNVAIDYANNFKMISVKGVKAFGICFKDKNNHNFHHDNIIICYYVCNKEEREKGINNEKYIKHVEDVKSCEKNFMMC